MAIVPEGGFRFADYPWATDVAVDEAAKAFVHVDNVKIALLFHEARSGFHDMLVDRIGADGFDEQVIAHIALDFVTQLVWRPTVRIAARIERVGTSSYSTEMLLVSEGEVFVRCLTTNVWVVDGRPRPISAAARQLFDTLTLSPPAPTSGKVRPS